MLSPSRRWDLRINSPSGHRAESRANQRSLPKRPVIYSADSRNFLLERINSRRNITGFDAQKPIPASPSYHDEHSGIDTMRCCEWTGERASTAPVNNSRACSPAADRHVGTEAPHFPEPSPYGRIRRADPVFVRSPLPVGRPVAHSAFVRTDAFQ